MMTSWRQLSRPATAAETLGTWPETAQPPYSGPVLCVLALDTASATVPTVSPCLQAAAACDLQGGSALATSSHAVGLICILQWLLTHGSAEYTCESHPAVSCKHHQVNGRILCWPVSLTRSMSAALCFKCQQPGHLARDCPSKFQNAEQQEAAVCLRCGRNTCPAAGVPDFHRY